ncbi:hypothetical protein [Streptacidiphilus rugosus]|uniref:hypothetical protein n=1 Tax=Streptacidiphilus rugosus TaxID=405783 RepID=UPI0005659003|nr:hypothetical protein [Streptacidiphilus rugosus]
MGLAGRITAVMVWHGRTVRPTLIAELPADPGPRDQAGTAAPDPQLSLLHSEGFAWSCDLHEVPGAAPGWSVHLVPRSSTAAHAEIIQDGAVVSTDTVALPPGFLDAAEGLGWLVLYCGDVGLPDIPGEDQAARLAALNTAAATGRVAGASVAVRT